MQQERAIILIDGSNFYFKLLDLQLHNLLTFDFSRFAQSLVGKRTLIKATYYIGKVRTDGTKKTANMHANQQRLFDHLKSISLPIHLAICSNLMVSFTKKV